MPLPILEFHKDLPSFQDGQGALLFIPQADRSADCACWGLSFLFCLGSFDSAIPLFSCLGVFISIYLQFAYVCVCQRIAGH